MNMKSGRILAFLLFLLLPLGVPAGAQDTGIIEKTPIEANTAAPLVVGEPRKFTPPIIQMEKDMTPRSGGQKTVRMTIDRAVGMAVEQNPAVKIARSQIEKAQGQYRLAKSGMGFRLNLNGSYSRVDPVNVAKFQMNPDKPAQEIKLGDENNFGARAVLEKVITTFGKLEYSILAAALQVGAYEGNYETVRQEIIFRTKEGYFQVLRSQGMARISQEKLDIVLQQLKITRDLFDAGVVPKFEVLKAELAVSQTRQRVIAAENNSALALASLMNIMTVDQSVEMELENDGELVLLNVDMDRAQALALQNRPEVKAILISRQAVAYLLKSATLNQNPVLSFTSTAENKTISGFNSNPNTFTQMFVLSIPLSDGGATGGKIQQARAELEELDQNIVKLYQNFQLEVKQAVLTIRDVEARLESARRDISTAREGYDIALTRYKNGISTSLELNDALQSLNEAKINLLATEYEYKIAVARLERATATNWKGAVK